MDVAGSMNIMFKADLSHLCDNRPSVLYWVIQPGSSIGGVGAGVIRMVRPWNEWLIAWGYDIYDEPPVVARSEERRVGQQCVSTCSTRWPQSHSQKKSNNKSH